MCPLTAGEQRLGIVNFESTLHLRPTKTLSDEIKRIVDSVAYLLVLKKAHDFQCKSTGKALHVLGEFTRLPLTDKDRVFVASSSKADASVTGLIISTLEKFDVAVSYWKIDTRVGNIPDHLWNNLSSSVLGICYFSEPTEIGQHKYSDNPNVLFEAGMMHALYKSGDVMKAWIPVREQASPPSPFDFGFETIITVPRSPNGEINEDQLAVMLTKLLKSAGLPYPRSS